ncbi:MAG: ABC transporter substrate-binding protein [Candidatus Paceibacterota bacterium]
MNKHTKIVGGIILIIIVILLTYATRGGRSSGAIKIGVIAPLSGPFASYGEDVKKGIQAGVSDSAVELIFEDEKCEPKDAITAFHKLIDVDKAHFILGPACGSPQEAIVPLLAAAKTVAMVPSAASRGLFVASGGYFFNIQYSLEDESTYVAKIMYERGLHKVALVTYANAFSKTHADSFRANFKGDIVIDTVLLDNNANLLTELAKIKAAKIDAIYAPDIAFFFAGGTDKLRQLSMTMPVFTTYVAELPSVIPLVEGVYYSFPADITETGGAVYNLSKQAAETLVLYVTACRGDSTCVREKLLASGKFDEAGVYKRGMILKQIVKGEATVVK